MGDPKPTKPKRIWLTVLVIVGVIVVAGGAGALLSWQQRDKKEQQGAGLSVARNLQTEIFNKKLDTQAASAKIDEALKQKNLSNEDKYYLYFQKGSIYHDAKDYKSALENYKKAAALMENDNIYEAMATAAKMMGDKAQAIKYYERAIALVPNDSPVKSATKERLQLNIDGLNGKPLQGPPPSLAR